MLYIGSQENISVILNHPQPSDDFQQVEWSTVSQDLIISSSMYRLGFDVKGSAVVIINHKDISNYSILFYSILFYSILFYSILFYSILFYSILFYSILFYSILFYSIIFISFHIHVTWSQPWLTFFSDFFCYDTETHSCEMKSEFFTPSANTIVTAGTTVEISWFK